MYVLAILVGLPPSTGSGRPCPCPRLLHVLALFYGWPARRAVAASVYPASGSVRVSECRTGVSRDAVHRAIIPCRGWVRGSICINVDVSARHLRKEAMLQNEQMGRACTTIVSG